MRNAKAEMVPIRALAEAKLVQGPQTVVRYNGYRAAIVNGAPKPGYSSGQALAAMERISAQPCRLATASNGPAPRCRRRRRVDARASCWGSPFSSLICFSLRSTKAGTFRFRLYSRSASACLAPSSRWYWPD